jgi:uncharacterized protein
MSYHRRLFAGAGIAFALLLLQLVPLDNVAAAPATTDVDTGRHNLLLWRISGGKGTAFLLGSVHVGSANLFPLPQEMEQAFRSADYLVEEINLKGRDLAAAARQFWLAHGRYTDGDRLENHISEETKTALTIYLQLTGRPATAFSLDKPWFTAFLINHQQRRHQGFSVRQGVDEHFADEAAAESKPVIELETQDYQLNLLYWRYSTLSDAVQDKFLLWSILHAQNSVGHLRAIIRAWQTGDAAAIAALNANHGDDPQSELYFDEIINKRNFRMAQQIEVYLGTPYTYFVVVGAAHVVGNRGIVELLKEKGYRIDQLTSG